VSDHGRRQEILENNNKITLPNKLDPTTLAQLITEAFTEVHKNKKPHQCAAIAAKAVWNLYDGKCKLFLEEWTTEIIRQKNPYRQGEEIAKVMDLSPGQLNLAGFRELRMVVWRILCQVGHVRDRGYSEKRSPVHYAACG
jgi:hypothetical protein